MKPPHIADGDIDNVDLNSSQHPSEQKKIAEILICFMAKTGSAEDIETQRELEKLITPNSPSYEKETSNKTASVAQQSLGNQTSPRSPSPLLELIRTPPFPIRSTTPRVGSPFPLSITPTFEVRLTPLKAIGRC